MLQLREHPWLILVIIYNILNLVSVFSLLNVTILIYGIRVQQLLQSLPYTAPGFDLGIRDAYRKHNSSFRMSPVYVSANLANCDDTGAYFDHISHYFYKDRLANASTVLFYPGCDDSTTFAQLGREWNMFILSSGTTYSNLRDRNLYPSTIAFGPVQYEIYGAFAKKLLATYGWTSMAFIYDISGRTPFNRIVFTRIQNFLRRYAKDVQMYPFQIDFGAVVFISVPHPCTRNFLVMASKKGWKTGDIVWVSIDVAQGPRGNLTWKSGSPDDASALETFRSIFKLESCSERDPKATSSLLLEFKNRSEQEYNVTFPPNQGPSEYVFTAYNAIQTFAKIFAELLKDGGNPFDGSEIARRFLNRTFYLNTGDQIYVDTFGERQNRMCLMDFDVRKQTFQTVQYFFGTDNNLLAVPDRTIDWSTPDNLPPANEPACGFRFDRSACLFRSSITAISVTITLAVIILLVIFAALLVRKLKFERGAHPDWWVIHREHLLRVTKSDSLNQIRTWHRSTSEQPLKGSLAKYRGQLVWMKFLLLANHANAFPNTKAAGVLENLRSLASRDNICKLIGVIVEPTQIIFMTEYCQKGSLLDLQETAWVDWDLQCFFISDLLQGLLTIHGSPIKRHGHLRLSTCLIDKQLSIKLAEVGFYDLIVAAHIKVKRSHPVAHNVPEDWMAPELRAGWIQHGNILDLVTKADASADMYSFSTIVRLLTGNSATDAVRNSLIAMQVLVTFDDVVAQCQALLPVNRPTINQVKKRLTQVMGSGQAKNLIDRLLQRLEVYSCQLELAVAERTQQLLDERSVCDLILQELLPKNLILELRAGITVVPQVMDNVTVFFSYWLDFPEFVQSHRHNLLNIQEFLANMFSLLDNVIGTFDVYKVEAFADTYMVASGLTKNESTTKHYHLSQICQMAKAFLNIFHAPLLQGYTKIQIGIHAGSCAGGIVGFKRPRYCLFGDTVNTASRLASNGLPSKIHLSETTAALILDKPEFTLTRRGVTYLKGKGDLTTYWLS